MYDTLTGRAARISSELAHWAETGKMPEILSPWLFEQDQLDDLREYAGHHVANEFLALALCTLADEEAVMTIVELASHV